MTELPFAARKYVILILYKNASGVNLLSPTNEPCRVLLVIFVLNIPMKEKFYGTIPFYKNDQRGRSETSYAGKGVRLRK